MNKFDPTELPEAEFLVYQAVLEDAKQRPWDEGKWVVAAFSALIMWEQDDPDSPGAISETQRRAMIDILIQNAPPSIVTAGSLGVIRMMSDDNPL